MQAPVPFHSSPLSKLYSFKKSCSSAKVRPHDLTVDSATANMYDLLSVRETAGQEEIKAAYKSQARRWHPDVCPSYADKLFFTQQFIKARQAYEVLSDPVLRREYDSALSGKGCDEKRVMGSKFGDWETQLGLKNRSFSRAEVTTWGSRMRRSR